MAFGLLGEKLGHSYSVMVHKLLGNDTYTLYEKSADELDAFLKDRALQGLNVTIPYKKTVMPYCTSISQQAKSIGAVNTIVRKKDGWHGYNTDYDGFLYLLKRNKVTVRGFVFLILGDGATSKTIQVALKNQGAKKIIVLSRKKAPFYHEINKFYKETDYIINATSVGTFPNTEEDLISLDGFTRLKGVFDVIYNPFRTKLLIDAEKRGLICANGLAMLVAQAYYANGYFFPNHSPSLSIDDLIKLIERQKSNLILVGMPGVGKTTMGKLLAKKLDKTFYDSDRVLKEEIGDLNEFIKAHGEEAFRQKETAVLNRLGNLSNMVLATGGGVVTRENNYYALRRNGRIYQLDKPLSELSTKNRPFSQGGFLALKQLYQAREGLYRAFRQEYVHHQTKEQTLVTIMEDFYENCGD